MTIGLYGAKREKATGMRSSVDSHKSVLLTKKNMAGTMMRKEPRMMRIKPKRSARMPPIKVMTTPMKNSMDKAKLPWDGEAWRT